VSERRSRLRRVLVLSHDADPASHAYMRRLAELLEAGQLPAVPGSINHIAVRHDSWCPKLAGGLCSCDCELEVRTSPLPEASA